MGAKMSNIDKCFFFFFGLVDWTMEVIGILKGKKKRKILTKWSSIQGQVKYNSSLTFKGSYHKGKHNSTLERKRG